MSQKCPKCYSQSKNIRKYGNYFRKSDSQHIQRFKCNKCRSSFSTATDSPLFGQKKRRLNSIIQKLLVSNVSQRRIALILQINIKTVVRKRRFLAQKAQTLHNQWLQKKTFEHLLWDDLETIEHTKLKPVTVSVIVNDQRKIIGFDVAAIPAKGHLSHKSLKKYGPRPNKAPAMREKLCSEIRPFIHPRAVFQSDGHRDYAVLVRRLFPQAEHRVLPSIRSCVAGQGELKKAKFDPLFNINHTLAMLRANVHRLIRRSWNTTKCLKALREQLMIYMYYHNHVLTR